MKRFILSSLALFWLLTSPAQFGTPRYLTQYSSGQFVMDDLNGDGLDDMVTIHGGIRIFINNGEDMLVYSQSIRHYDEAIYYNAISDDLNNDGFRDVIINVENELGVMVLEIYLNAGNGYFDYHSSIPVGSYCYAIILEDINTDGLKDIVYGANGFNGLFYQQEDLVFESEELQYEDYKIIRFVSDIDTDGDLDLVTESNGEVNYYENNNGIFGSTTPLMTTDGNRIRVIDTDQDGDDDITYVTVNNWIAQFKNLGNLQFSASSTMAQVGTYISDYKMADPDTDGDLDILVDLAYEAMESLRIYNQIAGNYFLDENLTLPAVTNTNSTSGIGNLNGDEFPDLVMLPVFSTCYAYLGNAENTYEQLEIFNYSVDDFRGWIAADLNGDGYEELIVSDAFQDSETLMYDWFRTTIFQINSQGEMIKRIPILEVMEFDWGFVPSKAADFNGDGLIDLLGWQIDAEINHAKSIVLIQDSLFHFTALEPDLSALEELGWRYNYYHDMDEDGDVDIVSHATNLEVLFNDGSGGLSAPVTLAANVQTGYQDMFFFEDFTGDGLKDIVTDYFTLGVVMMEALGNGQFAPASVIHSNGAQPYYGSPTVSDYDLDGDLDLLFVNQIFDGQQFELIYQLTWVKNGGNGTWSSIVLGDETSDFDQGLFELSDVVGDAKPEIIAMEGSSLKWFDNAGETLGTAHTINQGLTFVDDIMLSDINGDGAKDLLKYAWRHIEWYPNLIGTTSQITGVVYWDENENGQREFNEQIMQGIEVALDETPAASFTNSNGEYEVYLFEGEYNLSLEAPPYWELSSPGAYTIVVNAGEFYSDTLNFGLKPTAHILDLEVDYAVVSNVCDVQTHHQIQVANYGTYAENMFVNIQVDTIYDVISSSPAADSIVGNHFYFHIDSLGPYQPQFIMLEVQNPSAQPFGNDYLCSAVVCVVGGSICRVGFTENPVLCSYDPNDKQVYPVGLEAEHYTLHNDTLVYTIRFQNTGNYPARDVRIEDKLDADLDWNTLKFISSSHPITAVSVNEYGRAIFKFSEIWLPDSIADEPGSHGFVKFIILPKETASIGTRIENKAEIYFDLNEAIVTNSTWNTLCSDEDALTVLDISDNNAVLSTAFTGATYQWYRDDVLMTDANSGTVVAEVTGNYQLLITDAQGCLFESDKLYTIAKNDRSYSISYGPNPAQNHLSLTITAIDLNKASVRLYNAVGDLSAEYALRSNTISLDVSNLASGVYFIRVFDGTKWMDGVEKVTIVD